MTDKNPVPLKRRILRFFVRMEDLGGLSAKIASGILAKSKFRAGVFGSYADGATSRLPAVLDKARSSVVPPRVAGEPRRVVTTEMAPIVPLIFENARVSGNSSIIVTSQGAFTPQIYLDQKDRLFATPENAYQVMQVDGRIVTRQKYNQKIEKGICVFGSGATNWYHWVMETVPRAALARKLPSKYDDYPLLVPASCKEGSTFETILEPFKAGREIIRIPDYKTTLVGELVQIEPPSFVPCHVRNNDWPVVEDHHQNVAFFKDFRRTILTHFNVKPVKTPKRLFLARASAQNSEKRDYNQDELIDVAKKYDFTIVRPETLNLKEQLELFQGAEIVAGASGAAWTNMLFCNPGMSALIWCLNVYDQVCVFSNLSEVSGADICHFFVEPDCPVENSDEAFRASYMISPKVFEQQLLRLVAPAPKLECTV